MERVNFQAIEKKWQKKFATQKLNNKGGKKFYCLEMFLYRLVKYIWGMSEITPLVM